MQRVRVLIRNAVIQANSCYKSKLTPGAILPWNCSLCVRPNPGIMVPNWLQCNIKNEGLSLVQFTCETKNRGCANHDAFKFPQWPQHTSCFHYHNLWTITVTVIIYLLWQSRNTLLVFQYTIASTYCIHRWQYTPLDTTFYPTIGSVLLLLLLFRVRGARPGESENTL